MRLQHTREENLTCIPENTSSECSANAQAWSGLQRQAGEQGNIRVAVCADMNSERPMRFLYVKAEAGIKRGTYKSH